MRSRAAILHDVGGPWSVEEFELDPPRAGEVLLEMAAAGMCHSDEHILNGDMSAPNKVLKEFGLPAMFPMIGGHEGDAGRMLTGPPQIDEPRRFEGGNEVKPADVEVTALGQPVGDDDRICVEHVHRGSSRGQDGSGKMSIDESVVAR